MHRTPFQMQDPSTHRGSVKVYYSWTRSEGTPNLDSTTSKEMSDRPPGVCTLERTPRLRVRHASSSSSSKIGELIRLLHSRQRLANRLLDNAGNGKQNASLPGD